MLCEYEITGAQKRCNDRPATGKLAMPSCALRRNLSFNKNAAAGPTGLLIEAFNKQWVNKRSFLPAIAQALKPLADNK